MQPIRRFAFDAAILFSDILVIPHALGQRLSFEQAKGPRLEALKDESALGKLRPEIDQRVLAPVYETIDRVAKELPGKVALLGFCGAPWTLATYIDRGKGNAGPTSGTGVCLSPYAGFFRVDRSPSRGIGGLFDPAVRGGYRCGTDFRYLGGHFAAGRISQLHRPCASIIAKVRKRIPNARMIGFPRGAATKLKKYVTAVPVDAVGLDWMIDLDFAHEEIQSRRPVQGNLDPLALLIGGKTLDAATDRIIKIFASEPFIFNLGHGVLPDTPVAHIERLIARVNTSG